MHGPKNKINGEVLVWQRRRQEVECAKKLKVLIKVMTSKQQVRALSRAL